MSDCHFPYKLPSFSDIDTSGVELPEDHLGLGELQLPSFDLKDIINEDDHSLSNTDYMNNNTESRKEFLKPPSMIERICIKQSSPSSTALTSKEKQSDNNNIFPRNVRIPKLIKKMKRKEMKESLKVCHVSHTSKKHVPNLKYPI